LSFKKREYSANNEVIGFTCVVSNMELGAISLEISSRKIEFPAKRALYDCVAEMCLNDTNFSP